MKPLMCESVGTPVPDRLLLTKTDLASPPPALMHRLKEVNATAPVLIAHHGQIDPHDLLNGCLYEIGRASCRERV